MTHIGLACSVASLVALIGFGSITPRLHAEQPQRTYHVRDFGAVVNSPKDAGDAIRAAISKAIADGPGAEVVLEAGTYRVQAAAARGYCFPIRQAANLTVRGAGKQTRIVVTNPATGAFSFGLCQQVNLRDLTIDYDPLPFCQGTIRDVSEAGHFDLEIEAGYPTPDADNFVNAMEPYGKWGMIMDPTTRRIRAGTNDHHMTPRWEHQHDRVWRFYVTAEHYRRGLQQMQIGDRYVHLARGYGAAVIAQGCQDIQIDNVQVHASPGLAVGLVGNQGQIVVRSLEVRFPAGSTRLLTTNADGVHCQQNRSGPIIEQCYFEGMADDAINIYAPPNVLREIRLPTQWLVSPGCVVLPGDRLQVLDPRLGQVRGVVRAVESKREGRGLLLTLEQPLDGVTAGEDFRSADTLYNLDACGAGFRIRQNVMRGNRRYGCLLRAGGGIVENNVFEDTTGAGVVLTNEPDWPEGPVPWGITIRGNRFIRGGTCLGYADSPHGAALTLRATRLGHQPAAAEELRDIVIERNEFVDRAGAAICLAGTRNVRLQKNRITVAANVALLHIEADILCDHSRGVTILDNEVVDLRPNAQAAVQIGANVAAGEDGIRISNLSTTLSPHTHGVIDRRN